MVSEADRAPAAAGVKFTLMVQVPAGATLEPMLQVLLVMLNSVLLTVVAPSTSAAVPVFVKVMDCAVAFAPTFVDANVSALLESDAVGDVTTTATPVPDRLIALLAGVALWATLSDPESVPAEVGLNAMEIEQLPPTAMLAPAVQVFDASAKLPVTVVAPSTSATVPVLLSVTD